MASKVVVIDNDSQVRGVVCAALEQDGFVAVGVESYPDAIEQLSWSPADLVISDGFTTEGVTGVSLLHRLFPTLRLLVLSGSVAHKLEIPFSTHCLSILPKPCSVQALRQAVRRTPACRKSSTGAASVSLWRRFVRPALEKHLPPDKLARIHRSNHRRRL